MKINRTFAVIILLICFFVLGWFVNDGYRDFTNKRTYNGLMFSYNISHPEALQQASKYDPYGHWVCVNIKGMDYKQAVETCDHETGHEIFANECGKNITRCMEVVGK